VLYVQLVRLGNGMKHVIQSRTWKTTLLQAVEACLGDDEPRRRDEVEAAAVIQIAGITRTA